MTTTIPPARRTETTDDVHRKRSRPTAAAVLATALLAALVWFAPGTAGAATTLGAGGTLSAGQSLTSPDNTYRLVMQGDGNLVLYRASSALWYTTTAGSPGARAVMQGDGNLVVYASTGRALWNSGTAGSGGAQLVVQNDGNVVIYSSYGVAVWSRLGGKTGNTASTIWSGHGLAAGQRLVAADGSHFAIMQEDGNLVVYRGGTALWATHKYGTNNRLVMQDDGNLVVYASNGVALWNSGTSGVGRSFLRMQPDGNLVVYRADGRASWSWMGGRINLGGAIGDDYPYRSASMNQIDPWNFYFRNCTSFAAWRMNSANKVGFTNTMGGGRWGNANTWDDNARRLGYAVNGSPARGAIAQSDSGTYGHVAWVAQVHGDGTVTIEEYNRANTGVYSSRRVAVTAFRYIHVRDL